MATQAPSCRKALDQATALWPKRSKATDGICGDLAHQSRTSDHNPGDAGYCHAYDLTHDPGDGCDCGVISENLRKSRDPRIKYVIHAGRIFAAYNRSYRKAWTWGKYDGSNPHNGHMHVSVWDTSKACRDTSDWAFGKEDDDTVDGSMRLLIAEARTLAARDALVKKIESIPKAVEALGRTVVAHIDLDTLKGVEAWIDDRDDIHRFPSPFSDEGLHKFLYQVPNSEIYTDGEAFGDCEVEEDYRRRLENIHRESDV